MFPYVSISFFVDPLFFLFLRPTPLMWIETVWFTSAVVIDLDRSENVKKSEPFASPSGHTCRPKLLQRRKQWQKQRRRPKPRPRPRLRRCQKPRRRRRLRRCQKPKQRRKPRQKPWPQWFESSRLQLLPGTPSLQGLNPLHQFCQTNTV